MEKIYKIPQFGMVVTVTTAQVGYPGSGTVISNLHTDELTEPTEEGDDEYNSVIDGIESLILAHAVEGIDISAPAYVKGIQTAVDAAANNT
jgi:hypothetical protein